MQRQATQLLKLKMLFSSVHFSHSVMCDSLQLQQPIDCSTPGLPVHHQLPEFTQTHIHWIGDVIQPSSPLSPLSSPVSIFPSIRVFSNELALHIRGQTPKARKVEPHSLQTKSTNTRGTPPWDQMSSGSWIRRRMPGISSVEGHFPKVKKRNYATR